MIKLLPFFVFAVFYVGLSLYAGNKGFDMPWYKVPMPIALGVAKGLGYTVDSFSLISCLYYQSLLALAVIFAIVFNTKKGNRK